MSTNNNKTLKIVLGVLVALLIATGFYAFNLYNKSKHTEAKLVEEKNQVIDDLSAMAKQYDIAIAENDSTNNKLLEARDKITNLIETLKKSKASVNSLLKYKKKYLALEEEMNTLLEENDRLKAENKLLVTTLDSTQVELKERSNFTDTLIEQNTKLANTVKDAATLQTVGLNGFGVIERNSGKIIPTERARRTDKVKVCFTVAKNTLADTGDKEFYVQVIDPNNNVLGSNEQVDFDDKVLNYSLVSKFNYNKDNLKICEFVKRNDDEKFLKGRYVINVFNKTERVSTSEFTLR